MPGMVLVPVDLIVSQHVFVCEFVLCVHCVHCNKRWENPKNYPQLSCARNKCTYISYTRITYHSHL